MTLVHADTVPPQPWRNGGGRTRELLAWPDAGDWRCRVSVADIEVDGPFSPFPGVRRWFAVIAGAGVELTIDGRHERMTPKSAPLSFSGQSATTCRLLDGPTLDLNLMLRDARGSMQAVADGVEWHPTLDQCGLFTRSAGRCVADGIATAVPPRSLLWFDRAPAELSFMSAAPSPPPCGWWIEVGVDGGAP